MQTIDKFYYDILAEQAQKAPDREAIVMGDIRLTYSGLVRKIDQVASTLLGKGLHKGDKVALWATASPAWIYTYYGIIRSGGIALILNANLTLRDAGPLVEFADTKYMLFGKNHDIAGHAEDAEILSDAFGLPVENFISILDEDFSDVPEIIPDTTGRNVRDDAFILYTSGTTAFPKAVLISQFSIINVAAQLEKGIHPIRGEKAILGVPLFHVYAIFAIWIYLSNGDTLILPETLKADIIARLVGKEEVTDLWSVAAIYQGIIDDAELTAITSPRLRICSIAGSYISPVQFMRLETALTHTTFINFYGMTETSGAYTFTRPDDDVSVRYNTVGRAIDGVEAAVWDEEHGILPPGEVGEIITRGFDLKNGYYKLPPEKQAVDENGWLHSGDLGVFDEQGNLRIVGRIKDLIIKGGENLAPAEIEAQVMSHPSVVACRIFGYRDRIYGENLAACVTVAQGETFSVEEIKKYMKKKVGSYKSPAYYFVYEAFPLNANGKIDQRNLHIDMLRRLHKLRLEGKLEKGIQIIRITMKNTTYNITPVSALFEECVLNLGCSRDKGMTIRLAVEEALNMRVNEKAEDIGDIDIGLYYMQTCLRITVTDNDMEGDPIREDQRRMAWAILLRLVDDCKMQRLENGKNQVVIDFSYDKDFDIKDFLVDHEPIN